MKKIYIILLVLISGLSNSAIFQVNLTVQDHVDNNPGDGVCDIPAGGFCTLRAAIMEANALPGVDVIVLPGNSTIKLSLSGADENSAATGDLDITDAVSIGAFTESKSDFPTIDANGIDDRVFHVLSNSGLVTFVNFRVVNGSSDFSSGGAINISINNQVEIYSVWFEDNTADSGGAIYMTALSELKIVDSVFVGNAAVSQGGAITAFSPIEIDQSTIYDNLNFNNNRQEAIYVGIDQFGTSDLSLRNSTVFNNSNTAVYAVAADVSIRNSTIAEHSGYGVIINPDTNVTPDLRIRNSIFNQNVTNCASGLVNRMTNNWNITSDDWFCYEVSELQDSTTITGDPKLTSLKVDADNWHRYYRPGFYSPVVDSAHPSQPGPGIGCDAEDQRGIVRAQDGDHDGTARCDRGAIELMDDVIFYDNYDISY